MENHDPRDERLRYVVGVQWPPEIDVAAKVRLESERLLRDFVDGACVG